MESRRGHTYIGTTGRPGKSTPLPDDYLQLVREVFTTHYDAALQKLGQLKPNPRFDAAGAVFPNEIVLGVSLQHEGQLAATTLYASVDFDPKASAPTAQELLSACVDAVGAFFDQLLTDEHIPQLADESLAAFENVPFEWTPLEVDRFRVYLKLDKSNPLLDRLADEWLEKNDPREADAAKKEHEETEKLFVTGPKSSRKLH
jgi:hypothetical protein